MKIFEFLNLVENNTVVEVVNHWSGISYGVYEASKIVDNSDIGTSEIKCITAKGKNNILISID